jgi:hypothetical protein
MLEDIAAVAPVERRPPLGQQLELLHNPMLQRTLLAPSG